MTVVVRLHLLGHVLSRHVGVEVELLDLARTVIDCIFQFQDTAFVSFLIFLRFFIHFLVISLIRILCVLVLLSRRECSDRPHGHWHRIDDSSGRDLMLRAGTHYLCKLVDFH